MKKYMNGFVPLCAYAICAIMAGFYWKNELIQSILMLLWICDTITWILRYYRMWKLRSRAIRYGTASKALLLWIPFLIHITAEAVNPWYWDRITSIVFATLCIAELISITQNIQIFKTWIDITEQDAVSKILNWLLWLLNRMLDNTLWKLQLPKQ